MQWYLILTFSLPRYEVKKHLNARVNFEPSLPLFPLHLKRSKLICNSCRLILEPLPNLRDLHEICIGMRETRVSSLELIARDSILFTISGAGFVANSFSNSFEQRSARWLAKSKHRPKLAPGRRKQSLAMPSRAPLAARNVNCPNVIYTRWIIHERLHFNRARVDTREMTTGMKRRAG